MKAFGVTSIGVTALSLFHCGGAVKGGSSAAQAELEDAGLCEGARTPASPVPVPQEHRPAPVACGPTDNGADTSRDGGGISCSSPFDCNGDAATLDPASCLGGTCTYDQCLTDADCPTGALCLCSSEAGGGDIRHFNECVPAACHIDSDCGVGEYCSPSRGYCGGVSGFYCHGPRDTCADPTTDCPCVEGPTSPSCVYAPQVGNWVCATLFCMG